jgi:hypothetical protein
MREPYVFSASTRICLARWILKFRVAAHDLDKRQTALSDVYLNADGSIQHPALFARALDGILQKDVAVDDGPALHPDDLDLENNPIPATILADLAPCLDGFAEPVATGTLSIEDKIRDLPDDGGEDGYLGQPDYLSSYLGRATWPQWTCLRDVLSAGVVAEDRRVRRQAMRYPVGDGGYGYGYGHGFGDDRDNGYGYSFGDGDGYGNGDGYGYGYGYSFGDGFGNGYGNGYGCGFGYGDGYGYGLGTVAGRR